LTGAIGVGNRVRYRHDQRAIAVNVDTWEVAPLQKLPKSSASAAGTLHRKINEMNAAKAPAEIADACE